MQSILEDVLATLRELKINIHSVNLSTLRIKIASYLDKDPSYDRNRIILEISDELSKLHGDLQSIRIKNKKITPADIILFGNPDPYYITKILNPSNLYKKAYIGLYGMNGTLTENNTKISWDLNNIRSDKTQIKNKFRDIVEIKLLSSIVTLNLPIYTSTQITTVLIDELTSQSFISKDRKFHFITYDKLTTEEINRISDLGGGMYNPVLRKLISDNSCYDNIFAFNPPIVDLDSITLSFARPTNICTIASQSNSSSCLINFELTYIDSAFNTEDI